jgi:hypothetical protein
MSEAVAGLHVFTFPQVEGWQPATPEDARAIGLDLANHGKAYATQDGRRVNPDSVFISAGEAYGGDVTTEGADLDGDYATKRLGILSTGVGLARYALEQGNAEAAEAHLDEASRQTRDLLIEYLRKRGASEREIQLLLGKAPT